jgi:chaperone required for assembly of F1-ATPase
MKRFYKEVSVAHGDGGFAVHLDGRAMKTPSHAPLAVPTQALASAIADEWRGQGDEIDTKTMPMTRMTFAAIDTAPKERASMIEQLLGFGRTDLVSYRAEHPEELAARQKMAWDPLLDWLSSTHNARLAVTAGIKAVVQPEPSLVALSGAIAAMNDYQLVALHAATTITGSLTIALALVAGRLTAEQAFDVAHVDEHFQAEKWGRDPEADTRRAGLKAELEAAEKFLSLLKMS